MNNRYLMMLKLFTINSPMKRADYMRKKEVFHKMGTRVMITSRKIPLYSKLISIGSNVWIASGVEFVTHDVVHYMLDGLRDGNKYQERIGCIEIGNNVFIGTGVKIMYDVKIGDNVVIGAGSLITKDIPSNSIMGGVPARKIGSFTDFLDKRKRYSMNNSPNNLKQSISKECEDEAWILFKKGRK